MRPIQLTIQGFGPFATREIVDFTELGHAPLFLINGPTGAGKSSILDAICYALYGETTGSERTGDQMRCDYADPSVLTEIEFHFELGGREFVVTRSPDQEVPKKRGEGTTKKAHAATLCEWVDGEQKLLANRPNPVAKAMVELIGLDVKQFRQVMVIPQGKFRELLIANSKDREQIFGQLFQTHIYTQIEKALFDRAAGIRKEKDEFDNQIKGALDVVSVSSEEELQAEKNSLKPQLTQAEQAYQADLKRRDELKQQHHAALELQHKFSEKSQLDAQLQAQLGKQSDIEQLRQQRQRARLAARLDVPYSELTAAQKQTTDAQKALTAKTELLSQAQSQLAKAKEQHLACVKQCEQTEALSSQLHQLEITGKKFAALDEQNKQLKAASETLKEVERNQQQAEQAAQQLDKQIQLKRSERDTALQQVATLDGKRHALQTLGEQIERRLRQRKLNQQVTEKARSLQQADTDYQRAQQQTLQAKHHADKLEYIWHTNQAAELAQRLQPGDACPVCGNDTHPQLAKFSGDVVTKDQVQAAREQQQASNQAEIERLKTLQVLQSDYDHLNQEVQQLNTEIEHKALPELDQLQRQQTALNEDIHRLAALNPDHIEQQLSGLEQQYQQAKQKAEASLIARQAADKAVTEAQTRVDDLQRDISSEFNDVAQVRKKYAEIQKQIKALNDAELQARAALTQAQNQNSSADAALTSARELLMSWQYEQQRTEQQWQQALVETTFADSDAYLAARLDDKTLADLDEQIRLYDQHLATLRGKLDSISQTLLGKAVPQPELSEKALADQQQLVTESFNRLAELRSRMDSLKQVEQKLIRLYEKNAELEKAYQVYGTLSDIANGRTGAKVSLHRFVLGVLLDDVLIQASQRLQKMSKGRYLLKRKEERAKGNAGSGLDLVVEDGYTSKSRDVATLSGGESFMAALSLALGLSDVVQSYSGGIRLDTLFIDEGFGSLDPESLDLAIQTLVDLQQGGRTIGIISHVSELKEQIALRLDVETAARGSRIRLVA